MSDDLTHTSTTPATHSPLVLDTSMLGRRPGTMRREARTVPAPPDLGVGMIGVPEGAEVGLDLRLEAVMEGVLASGTAVAPLSGECARCLEPVRSELEVQVQELYVYPDSEHAGEEEARLDGELLDLEQALRDAVVLALPLSPLCHADCPGLCARCGARLADVGDEHGHDEPADPRWSPLRRLIDVPEEPHEQ